MSSKKVESLAPLVTEDLAAQRAYVEKLKGTGEQAFALVAADTFVRGMRDSGYRSTATAIDEFVDNSFQARASRIDVTTELQSGKQEIANIAVIDDGHGMEPDMIRAAVLWGGTHRFNDRVGFGRYGFGLPSAAVSITERFEVYSKVKGGEWHCVVVDLNAIARGDHTNREGLIVAPAPKKVSLPKFVTANLRDRILEHGTVIVLVAPDRLTSGFKKAGGFADSMLKHLGLIYRGLLRSCAIYVNDVKVEAIDPLFIDPAARYYDVGNAVLAEELEPMQFDIRTEDSDQTGMVRMRFSYMAPKFQEGSKERLQIMKANNAYLIVTRAGRQIDLIKQTQYGKEDHNITLINYDRNWAIELDFDPVLDKEFGITVNKQQVTLSESVWQVLANHGIPTIVKQLRKRGDVARESLKAAKLREETEGQERESESTMREAEKFVRRQQKPSVEKEQKATEKVVKEAEKEAEKGGRPVEQLVRELIAKVEKHPYKIEFDSHPSAPFFRPEQWGAQKRIYINTAHRFFSDVYNGPDATPRMQAALELLLFVLGVCELDAIGEGQHFYENERIEWSKQLNSVLTLLDKKDPVIHAKSAKTEDYETALGIVPTDKTDSVSPSSLS